MALVFERRGFNVCDMDMRVCGCFCDGSVIGERMGEEGREKCY